MLKLKVRNMCYMLTENNLENTILAGVEIQPTGVSPSNSLFRSVTQELNLAEVRFSVNFFFALAN